MKHRISRRKRERFIRIRRSNITGRWHIYAMGLGHHPDVPSSYGMLTFDNFNDVLTFMRENVNEWWKQIWHEIYLVD